MRQTPPRNYCAVRCSRSSPRAGRRSRRRRAAESPRLATLRPAFMLRDGDVVAADIAMMAWALVEA